MLSISLCKTRPRSPHLHMGSAWLAMCCFGLSHITSAQGGRTDHPLDALSKDEIVATVDVLKVQAKITESMRFSLIALHEPPKERGGRHSNNPPRKSVLMCPRSTS